MNNIERPKALLVHRYIAPDIPTYGWLLPNIGSGALHAGYDVEIFSTQPSYAVDSKIDVQPYSENKNGVAIRRINMPLWRLGDFGKAVSGMWFAFGAFMKVLFGRYDVVMAATTPPVLVARVVSIAAKIRGSAFIYHCQDIHPEISEGQGPFQWNVVYRIFQWLDSQTCKSAERIVVLSSDMQRTLVEMRKVEAKKVEIINNFKFSKNAQHETSVKDHASALLGTKNNLFQIVFSGNLGRFQGLDKLVEGVAVAKPEASIELIFVGSGNAEASLRKQAEHTGVQVRFLGRQPKAVADCIVGLADLAVISLRPGLINYAYPSKTLDYLAAGTPLMAIVEPDSELAQVIINNKFGVVASPNNVGEIAQAVEESTRLQSKVSLPERMSAYLECEFGKEATLQKWQVLFESLINKV